MQCTFLISYIDALENKDCDGIQDAATLKVTKYRWMTGSRSGGGIIVS